MSPDNQDRRRFLAHALALSFSTCGGILSAAPPDTRARPNIIYILADDLGYADLSVYGQTDFQTPHLDRLARQGIRFTQSYANSAVCSASRIALITGRYQYRLRGGLEEPIRDPKSQVIGLPPPHPTLPSLLKKAGYRTALFGKWHLGYLPAFSPLKSGYDEFFGNFSGGIDYFTHKSGVGTDAVVDLYEGDTPTKRAGYVTDLLGDRAVQYIEEHDKRQPFFVSLHFTAPHWPWQGPDDQASSSKLKSLGHNDGGSLATYAKMVVSMDAAIGRVLKALVANGLEENTIVVFSSDNGGERFSKTWPLSGQKTELLEGGIRVPTLIRWPTKITPEQISTQVAVGMDWLPTLLAAAGAAPNPDYPSDGENLLPILLGEKPPITRTLFWRYKSNAQRAVRSGDWKYFKINDNEFLFNLANDVRERANLAQLEPEIFAKLKQQWEAWDATMLPITKDVKTHWINPKTQADHYRQMEPD